MKLPRNVKVCGVASFLTDVHSEIVLPLLPLFVTQALGLPAAFLGLIEGVADSTASLVKVGSGWLSDRMRRRKPLIVAGYTLSTIVKPLLAAAFTGWQVMAIRFGDRVGKGIRSAPRDATLADAVPEERRGHAFGFHRAMDTLGAVLGSAIAFVLMKETDGAYRSIFLWAAVPGLLAVLTLALFLREVPRVPHPPDGAPSAPGRPSPRLGWFLGVHGLFSLADFSYAIFLLRAESLGVAPALTPLIYLLYNLCYAALPVRAGRLSDRWGRVPVLIGGYALSALCCLGLALASAAWMAWALLALNGARMAVTSTIPRALVADLSSSARRGTDLGIYHLVVGLAALPASVVAGVLWDGLGPRAPFLWAAALSLVALMAIVLLRGRIAPVKTRGRQAIS